MAGHLSHTRPAIPSYISILWASNQYFGPTNTLGPPTNTLGSPTNALGPPTNTLGLQPILWATLRWSPRAGLSYDGHPTLICICPMTGGAVFPPGNPQTSPPRCRCGAGSWPPAGLHLPRARRRGAEQRRCPARRSPPPATEMTLCRTVPAQKPLQNRDPGRGEGIAACGAPS